MVTARQTTGEVAESGLRHSPAKRDRRKATWVRIPSSPPRRRHRCWFSVGAWKASGPHGPGSSILLFSATGGCRIRMQTGLESQGRVTPRGSTPPPSAKENTTWRGGRVWMKAPVSNTGSGNTDGGSNPSLSANKHVGVAQLVERDVANVDTRVRFSVPAPTACVAQLAERQVPNLKATGSIPVTCSGLGMSIYSTTFHGTGSNIDKEAELWIQRQKKDGWVLDKKETEMLGDGTVRIKVSVETPRHKR